MSVLWNGLKSVRFHYILGCFDNHELISWPIILYARQPIDNHYEIYTKKSQNIFFCSLEISTILVCILVSFSRYCFDQGIKSNSCSKYFKWCRLEIQISKDFNFCYTFYPAQHFTLIFKFPGVIRIFTPILSFALLCLSPSGVFSTLVTCITACGTNTECPELELDGPETNDSSLTNSVSESFIKLSTSSSSSLSILSKTANISSLYDCSASLRNGVLYVLAWVAWVTCLLGWRASMGGVAGVLAC